MGEVTVDQRVPEIDNHVEDGLNVEMKVDAGANKSSENIAYFDKNEETAIEETSAESAEIKEEINKHTMHCPKCDRHVTKVILRQKIIMRKQPLVTGEQPLDLLGCLSCLSLFTSTEHLFHGQSYVDGKETQTEESHVDIPPTLDENQGQTQNSKFFEILKSIVYGGFIELIASLSVVTSASACDATILTIVALALANLVAGIFLISHNLWDLRNDCYNFTNQQTKNQEPHKKYNELLGQVEHFPLHAFFVILSFLVFGIIPPLVYGYFFLKTNDKDFTMVVAAIVSLVCVVFLSTSKAYIERCTGLWEHVKIIMYSLTTAITVAGLPFVMGNLVTRLTKEIGLSKTSSGEALGRLPEVVLTNSSLAYY